MNIDRRLYPPELVDRLQRVLNSPNRASYDPGANHAIDELTLALQHLQRELAESRTNEDSLGYQLKDAERKLHTDELTGLPNQTAFNKYLNIALTEAREGKDSLLLYMDLNGMKTINDRYGHDEGDKYVKSFAEGLSNEVRVGDIVARLHGDEFAALLLHPKELRVESERVRDLVQNSLQPVREYLETKGSDILPGCSVGGIYLDNSVRGDPASILRQADQAMYKAKSRKAESDTPEIRRAS